MEDLGAVAQAWCQSRRDDVDQLVGVGGADPGPVDVTAAQVRCWGQDVEQIAVGKRLRIVGFFDLDELPEGLLVGSGGRIDALRTLLPPLNKR